jgi:hypothetical protein
MAYLVVIDRGYRGAVEVQFSDLLYVCRGLHGQLGAVELVLRGDAVTYAADAAPVPALSIGGHVITATPDPRRSLRELMAAGVRVLVDTADTASRGLEAERLVAGVTAADTTALAARWPDYEGVWFL